MTDWAKTHTLERFMDLVEARWHNPQQAHIATNALTRLDTKKYKTVRKLTSAIERLIVVLGVRYDPQVLMTMFLRCLPTYVKNLLASEAHLEYHTFETFSKKALGLEATLGGAQQPSTDGRKKKSLQEWKEKGSRLMMVNVDGTQTEIDDYSDLVDGSEFDDEDSVEGSNPAALSELANLLQAVRNHKAQHEDATRALDSRVLDLEQVAPRPDAGESSSAPSARQLEQRVDHIVAMLGDISTFAAPTTISKQLDTLKTEVQQLQLPNKDGNSTTHYKMPTFQIEKFDDYTHQDPVLWWEGFTTQLRILFVPKHAFIGALFLNSKGGCQIWLSHLTSIHGVDVADLKDKISWEELTRLWKKRFIVDDAPTLTINRLFGMTQGNTVTCDWLTEWQKIAATPDLDLPFSHMRREFYNRSCAALSLALGDREQYATFAEIIDKAREIIKTNRAAAHEKSTWQPTYVEKVKTGPRPQQFAAVQSDNIVEDPAAFQASPRSMFNVLMAQLRDYMHIAVPTPLMDAEVEVVDLHAYIAKIDREFKTQRYDDIDTPLLYVRIQTGEATCSALIDCGASRNYMSQDFMIRVGLGPRVWRKSQPTQVTLADGHTHKSIDRCIDDVPVYFAPHAREAVSFDILDTKFDMILGMSWLRSEDHPVNFYRRTVHVRDRNRVLVPCTVAPPHPSISCHVVSAASMRASIIRDDVEEMGVCFLHALPPQDASSTDSSSDPRITELLDAYSDVFKGPHGVAPDQPIRHEIIFEDRVVPPRGCIYRMSEEELSVLRAQLDDLLEKGWIRPSSSPYGAPLNAQTVKNVSPLLRIDDLLERLGGAKFFSKLDLKSGYHQLEIRQEDRYKTAFKTRYGHYKWLVMSFGLTNAPATFQTAMTTEFRHMLDRFVLIYLDDILVYSRSLDEHVEHLRTVLERLRQAKYKANRDKCEFARQEQEYLGHYVTPQGIRPLADKIEAIRVWAEPTNTTDVRSFMGFAGYYQRFITGYSRIVAPMTRLQSPKVPFVFDDDARRSFQALKTTMLMAPVLSIYDPTLPTRVTIDTFGYGVGAVLEQHDGDDWHPVEYFNHKVPPINSLDDARKKELLAFVMALKRWRHFLLGRHSYLRITRRPATIALPTGTCSSTQEARTYCVSHETAVFGLAFSGSTMTHDSPAISESTALLHGFDNDSDGPTSLPMSLGIATLANFVDEASPAIATPTASCAQCLSHGNPASPLPWMSPDHSHRDRLGHDGILTVVDRLSKYACFLPCKYYSTAPELALLLHTSWIYGHGVPEDIVSDRDTHFMSAFWTSLMQESGTKMKPSSTWHPQTDGQTERAHQTAQMMLRTLIRPDQKDWVDRLPNIEFAYNTSVHPAIGVTPFELHHGGRKGRIFADLLLPRPADIDAACSPASVRKYRELLAQANCKRLKSACSSKPTGVACHVPSAPVIWFGSLRKSLHWNRMFHANCFPSGLDHGP
ncbi:hypothetical protein CBR_g32122 [Chara braunii]|uniref:Integrase catalytic domain-containing protein n=1 Tax=Chara braunii TaxID=69332 RepID=A0A388LGJ9_CHABU|nr:hypothetical protein CBR_g32122 [Chara braunii]|eukprot:GBG81445.1 hypothetical protein CBR_g32122 [Chara braunii]